MSHAVLEAAPDNLPDEREGDLVTPSDRAIGIVTLCAKNNRLSSHAPLMPQVLALLPTVHPCRVYTGQAAEGTRSEPTG